MKALVTGVAGFIGSHLAASLLDGGWTVIGVDCFTDYYPRPIKEANLAENAHREGFRFAEVRIQDADWPSLLDGVTHVFHLAAQAGVRKSWGQSFQFYTRHNVEATQILLEACVDRQLTRFVHASSSSIYGQTQSVPMREDDLPRPISPYGVTKVSAEQLGNLYHQHYGVPVVAMRYFTVYGPRQRPDMAFHRFISAVLKDQPITLYGDGEQTRDFTFVSDAVAATVAAAASGVVGRAYNIGGGSRVSLNQVLQMLERVAGHRLKVVREAPQKGDMRDTYADTTLAHRELGFEPAVGLEQGLQAEYRWLSSFPALV